MNIRFSPSPLRLEIYVYSVEAFRSSLTISVLHNEKAQFRSYRKLRSWTVKKMCASRLKPRTVNKYMEYAKLVVKSLKAPNGEPVHKQTWDPEKN